MCCSSSTGSAASPSSLSSPCRSRCAATDARSESWKLFEAIENRFAAQVRWSIPLVGATGLWITFRLDLWPRFADLGSWWMDAMVFVWAMFMLIVFAVEPLVHRRLAAQAARDPARPPAKTQARAHLVLLDGCEGSRSWALSPARTAGSSNNDDLLGAAQGGLGRRFCAGGASKSLRFVFAVAWGKTIDPASLDLDQVALVRH